MSELELVRDFVNTADLEEGSDDLLDARGLARWLATHGLAGERDRARPEDIVEARAVREALRELLRANNGATVDESAAAATLDAAGRRAGLSVRFVGGDEIQVAPTRPGIGGVLAAAAEAMADGSWPRLKACRSDACRWVFYDQARNRSRAWCDMSVCGNREKARTYRKRHARAT
jgi:predicted RNA-binding Zn ribbon-like protein